MRLTPFVLRWALLSPGDKVLVAVSGGPDSLCLLHCLWTERAARGLGSVEAAHLDHGLRGDESAAEADWVAAWCLERGIRCHVGRADISAGRGRSVQEAAREARYAFLVRTAEAVGANKIATGHTRDDQAETVLANVLRGSGLDGLRGIPARRENDNSQKVIVRPLLDVSRAEVEAYNAAHELLPRRDPSNLSAAHYTRNRLRLELLPQLREQYNPKVDDALVRLSQIAARDCDYLAVQAAAVLSSVTRAQDARGLALDRAALAALHPALLRYVLRLAVRQVRGTAEDMAFEPTEALCRAVTAAPALSASLTLPTPLCRVKVSESLVTFSTAAEGGKEAARLPKPLLVPGDAVLGAWKVQAAWEDHWGAVRLDAGAVDLASLHVRAWQAGDKMDPLGLGGRHKKVSDIFVDAKVPRSERSSVPLVADAQGILWVAGYTQSERAKETSSTLRPFFLSVQRISPAGNGGGSME